MTDCNETKQPRDVLAIGVWKNEGAATSSDSLDRQYGRRIMAAASKRIAPGPFTTSSPAFRRMQTVRP